MILAAEGPTGQQQSQKPGTDLGISPWMHIVPKPSNGYRHLLTNFVGAVAACLVVASFVITQNNIDKSVIADPSPVSYTRTWTTDKKAYRPGDTIRFMIHRHSKLDNLVMLSLDTWENQTTGEIFPGPILGRVAKAGDQVVNTSRVLPLNLTPGEYILQGWVQPQTLKRCEPATYKSEPFTIVGPPILSGKPEHPAEPEGARLKGRETFDAEQSRFELVKGYRRQGEALYRDGNAGPEAGGPGSPQAFARASAERFGTGYSGGYRVLPIEELYAEDQVGGRFLRASVREEDHLSPRQTGGDGADPFYGTVWR